MLYSLVNLLLLIWAGQTLAEVREIQSMQEIIQHIDADTLVVFDIDNTVLEPTTHLGSDQWYYFLVKQFQHAGLSDPEAQTRAEELWNRTQSLISTKPVEAITPQIIENLQKNHIPVIALTARTFSIADITRQQLSAHGVDFAKSAPQARNGLIHVNHSASYKDGILFQGEGNDKGKTLVQFLEQTGFHPSKILFIDDKEKNTTNVHTALQELGIRHIEFRYGSTDKQVQAFNENPVYDELLSGALYN